VKDASGVVITPAVNEVAVQWGAFITTAIDFLVVAFVMFMIIKAMNKMKKAELVAEPTVQSSTDVLLTEIRDALQK
jgi:large conductance mechanosensitive channel